MAKKRISNRKRGRKTAKRATLVFKAHDHSTKVQKTKGGLAYQQYLDNFTFDVLGFGNLRTNLQKFIKKVGGKHGR